MTEPLVIVSADCHIGPRLVEDLRPHCPRELLSAFDAYLADTGRSKGRYVEHDASQDDEMSPWRISPKWLSVRCYTRCCQHVGQFMHFARHGPMYIPIPRCNR